VPESNIIMSQGPPPPNPLMVERFQSVVSSLFQQASCSFCSCMLPHPLALETHVGARMCVNGKTSPVSTADLHTLVSCQFPSHSVDRTFCGKEEGVIAAARHDSVDSVVFRAENNSLWWSGRRRHGQSHRSTATVPGRSSPWKGHHSLHQLPGWLCHSRFALTSSLLTFSCRMITIIR
jgi:hypothetical protein